MKRRTELMGLPIKAWQLAWKHGGAAKFWNDYLNMGLPEDIKSLDAAYKLYREKEKNES